MTSGRGGHPGWRRIAVGIALPLFALAATGCIRIQRTGGPPQTREDIEAHCRDDAEMYRESGRAYARCMNDHGYPHVGADDY